MFDLNWQRNPIEFYVGDVGSEVACEPGTLEDLATLVGEMAAVFWDRDCGTVELDRGVRFVRAAGVWRAFTGDSGTFIAQWYLDGVDPHDPRPISERPRNGCWSTLRTAAAT